MADYVALETSGHILLETLDGLLLETSPPSGTMTKIKWGTNLVVTDEGSGVIRADVVPNLGTKVDKDSVVAAATRVVQNMLAAGDTQPAFRILGDGKHEWGVGGATAVDTNLYRSTVASTAVLKSDQRIVSARGFLVDAQSGGIGGVFRGTQIAGGAFAANYLTSTDTAPVLQINGDGAINWGPGGTTAVDTSLIRSSPGVLKGQLLWGALGVATLTKAGTPVDADFGVTSPPVGTIVVDTTANKIWVRTAAATWKGVVVA